MGATLRKGLTALLLLPILMACSVGPSISQLQAHRPATVRPAPTGLSTSGNLCADLYANAHVRLSPVWSCFSPDMQKSWGGAKVVDDQTLYAALHAVYKLTNWSFIGRTHDGGYAFDLYRPGAHTLLIVFVDPSGHIYDDVVTHWGSH